MRAISMQENKNETVKDKELREGHKEKEKEKEGQKEIVKPTIHNFSFDKAPIIEIEKKELKEIRELRESRNIKELKESID